MSETEELVIISLLRDENTKLKLAVTKALELLEGNPTWTIDELHKYLKSLT